MHRIVVPGPSVEECGGRVFHVDGETREVHSWIGGLSTAQAYALTRDRKEMTRMSRRRLARKRKWKLEHKRLVAERRAAAIVERWDVTQDYKIDRGELRQMLVELMPSTPPADEDLDALLRTCAGSKAAIRTNRGGPSSNALRIEGEPPWLSPEEALLALRKYGLATAEVESMVGSTVGASSTVSEAIANLADLDDFEELLREERARPIAEEAEEEALAGEEGDEKEGQARFVAAGGKTRHKQQTQQTTSLCIIS